MGRSGAKEAENAQEAEPIEGTIPRLSLDPSGTVRVLRCSVHGCRWLLGRWQMLAEAQLERLLWDPAELHLALNLMGRRIAKSL